MVQISKNKYSFQIYANDYRTVFLSITYPAFSKLIKNNEKLMKNWCSFCLLI